MGFEGLGDLMRSRCLSQETQKPRWLFVSPRSPLFEIASMLMRFDHVASFIVNANRCIM